MSDTVGVIGLGNAGSAICKALSGRVPLVGFDLSAARRDAVADLQITCAASAAEVAAGARRIILSLPKPEASIAVVDEILAAGHRPEIVIETSTVTPKTAIDCHARCARRASASSTQPSPAAWPAWRPPRSPSSSAARPRTW